MEGNVFNCVSVGVGGQGVISATQIMASAALKASYQVRTAETHGMAQRGGSVSGYLRFGVRVYGPLIPLGGADVLLSFEPSETLRILGYAKPSTRIFINKTIIKPIIVYQDKKILYPALDQIELALKKVTPYVYFIDADSLAQHAGNIRTTNVIMLGVLSGSNSLPLPQTCLEEAILEPIPKKAIDVNKIAFQLGLQAGKLIGEAKN